ncbi:lipopolysaccharide assembly protein LapB [Lentibacillus sp. CBA3610]|uniref:tetratricopeptide repeat protein n=1 Tax=Lentibacillus sp. CBA3610 TaxID=2518176 RepID=UPI00159590A0|nr:hypothetical protein [Lentibacillus sp. CBA3610]QKY69902.1 hypothetical protein Len3610_10150 [Lentibacillus sp. CBA3610]
MQQSENDIHGYKENIIPFIPDGDFYFTKGVEAFQKQKFDVAIKWLRKAIEAAPKNPLYQCQMSIVYTEVGAYQAASQLLNDVLQSTNDAYTDCYYLLANNYAHLGQLNEAKKYAEIYLDKAADGDFREDAEHLLDLMNSDEENDEWEFDEEDELLVYQETIFQHMEKEEWEKAVPLLEEMMSLYPEHKLIKHDYTHALFFSGYTDDAIRMELDALAEEPNSLHCHNNLAIFYYETGRRKEYQTHIKALLNVYPIHEQQKLRTAITLARTGVYDHAYSRFKRLTGQQLKNHLSYYKWYSITAYQLGESSKALLLWKEGCKRHPELANQEGPWRTR